MRKVRQHERNPREKEIPDQPQMTSGFTVGDARRDQCNTECAGQIQQCKHCYAVAITNEGRTEASEHTILMSLRGGRSPTKQSPGIFIDPIVQGDCFATTNVTRNEIPNN